MFVVTPQFTNEPENRTAALNGRITLSCQASGDPSPTITWNRNQIPITGNITRVLEYIMRTKKLISLQQCMLY